jgi:hypothetical protein
VAFLVQRKPQIIEKTRQAGSELPHILGGVARGASNDVVGPVEKVLALESCSRRFD